MYVFVTLHSLTPGCRPGLSGQDDQWLLWRWLNRNLPESLQTGYSWVHRERDPEGTREADKPISHGGLVFVFVFFYCDFIDLVGLLAVTHILLSLFIFRRWRRMIQCLRSGRTTLRRLCVLPVAPSAITTSANTRCLHRPYSKAEASAASGKTLARNFHYIGSWVEKVMGIGTSNGLFSAF